MIFSREYSKLKKMEFTTIRKNSGYYYEGKLVKIQTPTLIFHARVKTILPINKAAITEELAQSDADMTRDELLKQLEEWYGASFDNFILIHLTKEAA